MRQESQTKRSRYSKYVYIALAGVAACAIGAVVFNNTQSKDSDIEMMDDINGLEFTQTMSTEEVEDTFLQELFEEEPYIMIVNSDPQGENFWFRLDSDRQALTSNQWDLSGAVEGADQYGNTGKVEMTYSERREYENKFAKAGFQQATEKYTKAYRLQNKNLNGDLMGAVISVIVPGGRLNSQVLPKATFHQDKEKRRNVWEWNGNRLDIYTPSEFNPTNSKYRLRAVHDGYYYDTGVQRGYSVYSYYDNDWSRYGNANQFTFARNSNRSDRWDIRLQDKYSMYISRDRNFSGWQTKVEKAKRGVDWGDGVNRWKFVPFKGRLGPNNEDLYMIVTGGYGLFLSSHVGMGNKWYVKGVKAREHYTPFALVEI